MEVPGRAIGIRRADVTPRTPTQRFRDTTTDASNSDIVIPVTLEKAVVQNDRAAKPVGLPSPPIPSVPSREHRSNEDGRRVENPARVHIDRRAMITKNRIRIKGGTSPDGQGIVGRHVDYLGMRGFDRDYRRGTLRLCCDDCLGVRYQVARSHRPAPHALYGIHQSGFLCEEGVSEIGCPLNVVAETTKNIRKRNQCLNAGIPVLLACCGLQRNSSQ